MIKNFSEENDICDLDDTKVCNSCEKCLGFSEDDYMEIKLDGLIKEDVYKDHEDFEIFKKESTSEGEIEPDYEFIEDHEDLREEYYKNIEDILKKK